MRALTRPSRRIHRPGATVSDKDIGVTILDVRSEIRLENVVWDMIRYLVPFSVMETWLRRYAPADSDELDMPYPHYLALIRRFLECVPVDEAWYLQSYPGVAGAIAGGVFRSAAHHFLALGYFEKRLPFAADRTDLRQPIPFADIRAATAIHPVRGGLRVRMSMAGWMDILRHLLGSVPVDEGWYRQTYPGVDKAIDSGAFVSAAAHFVQHGYGECRWPFAMAVEEAWYLDRYPDVARAMTEGAAHSAEEHFWQIGYREGRFPASRPAA